MHAHDEMRGTNPLRHGFNLAAHVLRSPDDWATDKLFGYIAEFRRGRQLAELFRSGEIFRLGYPATIPAQHVMEMILDIVPGLFIGSRDIDPAQLCRVIVLGI